VLFYFCSQTASSLGVGSTALALANCYSAEPKHRPTDFSPTFDPLHACEPLISAKSLTILRSLVGRGGFEPPTNGLKVGGP